MSELEQKWTLNMQIVNVIESTNPNIEELKDLINKSISLTITPTTVQTNNLLSIPVLSKKVFYEKYPKWLNNWYNYEQSQEKSDELNKKIQELISEKEQYWDETSQMLLQVWTVDIIKVLTSCIDAHKKNSEWISESFNDYFQTKLIRDLWYYLYTIWNKYIYNKYSDEIYEIKEVLENKWEYKLHSLQENFKEFILKWWEFYTKDAWNNNTYSQLVNVWWIEFNIENKNYILNKILIVWKIIYNIDKEYKTWYITVSKNWKQYLYDKYLNHIEEYTTLNSYSDYKVYTMWDYITINSWKEKVVLNLNTWEKELYEQIEDITYINSITLKSNTKAYSTNKIYDKKNWLLIKKELEKKYYYSAISWEYLWSTNEEYEDFSYTIDKWWYDIELKDLEITLIWNIWRTLVISITKDNNNQQISYYNQKIKWDLKIKITNAFINTISDIPREYFWISFDILEKKWWMINKNKFITLGSEGITFMLDK